MCYDECLGKTAPHDAHGDDDAPLDQIRGLVFHNPNMDLNKPSIHLFDPEDGNRCYILLANKPDESDW